MEARTVGSTILDAHCVEDVLEAAKITSQAWDLA